MKWVVIFILFGMSAAWCQTNTGNAQASGSCSPAVTGSNNHFTLSCGGISKEKAEELVRLMNGILSRQIDPKAIYSQLDQIQKEINSIRSAFADPLAETPKAEQDLWHQAHQMQMQCSQVVDQWNQAKLQATQDFNQKQLEWARTLGTRPRGTTPPQYDPAAIDREEATVFEKLVPDLQSAREKLVAKAPDYSATLDYHIVNNTWQALAVCSDFGRLTLQYQVALYQEAQKKQLSK